MKYTRFVDDITISGKFDLEASGIPAVVEDIIKRHGFRLAAKKTAYGSLVWTPRASTDVSVGQ